MQNRYVADVGDFGKYGLLRALTRKTEFHSGYSLGVVWYLVPDEIHNNDGKHVRYLEQSNSLSACDVDLHERLGRVLARGRSVDEISSASIFERANFYSKTLVYSRNERLPERRRRRERWLRSAVEATRTADVVFLDPDNGLECQVNRFSRQGPKYAYYSDIRALCDVKQSAVIYHHISRQKPAKQQVIDRSVALRSELRCTHDVASLLYHRGSARAFFLLIAHVHRREFSKRLAQFLGTRWSDHFERVTACPE